MPAETGSEARFYVLSCSVTPPTDGRALLRVDRIELKAGSVTRAIATSGRASGS